MHTGERWKETARCKTEIEIERGGREKWMKGRNFRGEWGGGGGERKMDVRKEREGEEGESERGQWREED